MGIYLNVASPNVPHIPGGMIPETSTAFAANSLVDLNTTSGYIQPSTSSTTSHTLFGVFVDKAVTTASSNPANVDVIPIFGGPEQLFIVDCTNVTATNQIYKRQALTNSTTIANTSTDTTANTGVFVPIALVGGVGGTQMLGYFSNFAASN